jgi:hypothetical protein
VILSWSSAFSDERSGLSFVSHGLSFVYMHLKYLQFYMFDMLFLYIHYTHICQSKLGTEDFALLFVAVANETV